MNSPSTTPPGRQPLDELVAALRQMPAGMRALPQWLLWRLEHREGEKKPRKVPYYASGVKRRGEQGSAKDRAALVSFEVVLEHLKPQRFDGVGFAFLPGDGLIGIDIDGAIDLDSGEISPRCHAIVEACASYTELSPSGRGVHIIVAGETATFKNNAVGVEVFCGRQFFTCTGRRWPGGAEGIAPVSDSTLRRLRATVREAAKTSAPARADGGAPAPRDDFKRINAMALAVLDAWVPAVFPTAKRSAHGYRVAQKDLGRELEEDLSITTAGIKDWGVHDMGDARQGGRTPIDVVVEWKGLPPKEALHWLASCLGVHIEVARAPRKGRATPSSGSAEGGPTTAEPVGGGAGAGDPPAPPPAGDVPPPPWRRRMVRTDNGYKDCRENVYILLTEHPALAGLVAYDEFAHRVMKTHAPPWDSTPGEWTTQDDYLLGLWVSENIRLTVRSEATLVAGVAMAAFAKRYHPVLAYLRGLPPWDEIERLPHWLHECLGADDTTYSRLVGAWFVMGMVRRIQQPGCQMDYMVVLEGPQGKRKSTALRTLVGNDDWFADTPIRIGDKDAMLSLAGKWLYEVGELDSFNRAEVTAVKQYVSSRVDRVREPFARRSTDRPRSGVFAGSTNQSEYFKDPTGARRFWPVACNSEIQIDKLREWRGQLFAEALWRLASEDADVRRYYPTREETEQYLVPEQEQREIGDPWFERLAVWVNLHQKFGDTLDEICEVDSFTSHELLTRALGVPMDRVDGARQMSTRVGIAMHKLGWEKRRDTAPPRLWRYWRPKKVAP